MKYSAKNQLTELLKKLMDTQVMKFFLNHTGTFNY